MTPPTEMQTQGVILRHETPLADIPPADEKLTHEFLLSTSVRKHHPVNVALAVRRGIEALPQTAGTFTRERILEGAEFRIAAITDEMVKLVGSWEASPHYVPEKNNDGRLVNPAYLHAERYADGIVKCKCGTLVAHDKTAGTRAVDLPHQRIDDHSDDCLTHWRYSARAELLERRKHIIEEMVSLGHSGSDCYDRLGLTEQGTITHLTEGIGVDIRALKEEYQQRRKNTIIELLTLFSPTLIGEVYGISATTVREVVNRNFDVSLTDFHEVRNRNSPETEVAASNGTDTTMVSTPSDD